MIIGNSIIRKLQQAVIKTSPAEIAMAAIFAEDMIAAIEYVKKTYPKVQSRGTFRLYNAEDKVCYEIVDINSNNFAHDYARSLFFDGKHLVSLNELLAHLEPLPNAVQENVSTTTLEASKEILDSVATMPVYNSIVDNETATVTKSTKSRRKPTVFEESESTTDGENE